ncbi:LiaF transmembrane domain-containing protein [Methanosalsum natronophilum]|uniref:LiaF transmembrane domain-containing protein n=1 Tax=Methanosalsum natronophilum TaxID=768733 RepID=UPI0035B5D323|nr:putative neutral ceramidase superfamily lipid hydrolase [Methanosalsum natronophilum]
MKKISYQLIFGIIIITTGFFLLLETTSIYDTSNFVLFIPSLFVIYGLYILIASKFRRFVSSLLIILLFGLFQLYLLDILTATLIVDWSPLVLIFFGLWIVIKKFTSKQNSSNDMNNNDSVNMSSIFGNIEMINASNNFKGGNIKSIFGACDLNLKLAETENTAEIKATVIFGSGEIIVPKNWNINIDLVPFFAGLKDNRSFINTDNKKVDLIITGIVAFGEISLKNES